jgi:hypothetical protein
VSFRVDLQPVLLKPLKQHLVHPPRILFEFKAHDEVVRKAHPPTTALCVPAATGSRARQLLPRSSLAIVQPVSASSGILREGVRASQVSREPPCTFALLSHPAMRQVPAIPEPARPLPPLGQEKLMVRVLSWLYLKASVPTAYASRFGFPYTGKAGFRLSG